MFNKILSNLAFSPSGIDQVSFYARRLKQEESIRRVGLVLIICSMFVQVFAALIPPEKSFAASNNDVISGGIDTVGELKSKYNARNDVKALYNRFGIDSSNMNTTGSAKNTSFNFKEQGSRGTRTVGRVNFASTNDNNLGNLGGSTFYSRSAAEWSGSTPAYYFDKQKGTDGNYYYVWVLKDCGNIAYRLAEAPAKPKPEPVKPTPKPEPVKPKPTPVQTPVQQPVQTPTQVQVQEQTTVIINQTTPVEEKPKAPEVCVNNPKLKPDDILCKCVDNPGITADSPQCTVPARAKTARNITHKLTPEQTVATKAKANDVIEYTLTTANTNVVAKKGYVVEDYIGDVLDYANLDTAYLQSQNGTYKADTKTIVWTNQTIPAKGELKKTFRVAMKSTIPSTNSPNATSTDFDCKIQNGYGTETIIPVECSPLKTVESLPNTGPGTTVAISFTITVLSGYFFMRSRLLAKEVGIVKETYQAGY